jgi:hypothetical protein
MKPDPESLLDLEKEKTMTLYNSYAQKAQELMNNKNHDYGEAWRDMRISSLTDLILMKLYRTKQIEDNDGQDKVNVEWICELSDGSVFTIYDWKEYISIDYDEEIEFHIGAKDKETSQRAADALAKLDIGEIKTNIF